MLEGDPPEEVLKRIVNLVSFGGRVLEIGDGFRDVVVEFHYIGPSEESVPHWLVINDRDTCARGEGTSFNSGTALTEEAMHDVSEERFKERIAEVSKENFERGRQLGIEVGREIESKAQNQAHVMDERGYAKKAVALVKEFSEVRDRYMQEVEKEVVELALVIAARILRREAQADPLLLTGAVRIALGQLCKSSQVLLRVPASQIELWVDAIAHVPNLALKPMIVSGEAMEPGDCEIVAELGSVDLGIRAQLGEIERGFFDRADLRVGSDPLSDAPKEGALKEQT